MHFPFGSRSVEIERAKEIAFWERFIGKSRIKLAEAFELIAPSGTFWMTDSPAFIDRLIPIETLRRMYADIPPVDRLDAVPERALKRLKGSSMAILGLGRC